MTLLKRNFLALILAVSSVSAMAQTSGNGKIRIVVSVDWEGRELNGTNLKAMKKFRDDYPHIPLQHFLNAAYYTKPEANARQVTQAINYVLRPGDEHGLHIHAWKSLVEASQVKFLREPTFFSEVVDPADCEYYGDCGHDVALTAYSEEELKAIINFSSTTLVNNGFRRPKSFRAGGWQADHHVLNALADSGITLDSSATNPANLKADWGQYNLYTFVAKQWAKTSASSQPKIYQAPSGAKLLELPNNGCLADYQTGPEMLKTFKANHLLLKRMVAANQANPVVYVSIGFHQETAAEYLPRVRDALEKIAEYANDENVSYEFVVAPL